MLQDPLFLLVAAACIAVVVILAIGISYFGKGDLESAKKSNKMMQWRIGAQALAVVLILLFLWMRSGG
ncbi:twin transmembrane helix small protein [Roseovarius faecimaris]|uniref:Twin transmembrane helix small protein n=1 Tax=Roseovarius faecimaris TaxID=2494550 RepID=A0A6I6IRF8_9RHOB|nr:twin transmembrane helix small protein [Roseovarius faecimaris]QGX99315.1 twin transmembrane helix small protein [Roseovarius faecimaris]